MYKENTPRIFVGDYASYAEGNLTGDWFELDDYSDKDEFYAAIKTMFAELDKTDPLDSGLLREEAMFQDWEYIPDDFISESSISPKFWEFMEAIEEKGWTEEEYDFVMDNGLVDADLDREDLIEIQSLMKPYYIARSTVTYAVVQAGCVKETGETIIRFASEEAAREFLKSIKGKYTHFIVQQFHDGKSWQDMEGTVRWAYDW